MRRLVYVIIALVVVLGLVVTVVFGLVPIFNNDDGGSERKVEYVQYVPKWVDFAYWKENGNSYMYVAVTFPEARYHVSSWGTPVRNGNSIEVNAEMWKAVRVLAPQIIVVPRYSYDLGSLEPGDYTFTLKVWNETVKTVAFTVPGGDSVEEWIQYVPSEDEVCIVYRKDNGPPHLTVTIGIVSGDLNVTNWGTLTRNGNNFEVNIELWKYTKPINFIPTRPYSLPCAFNNYYLGDLESGDYVFIFKVWGHIVETVTFNSAERYQELG
ncbi:MAG: hypothetical protein QXI91_06145 [Candidatus Bathyarchaeia archaeon]